MGALDYFQRHMAARVGREPEPTLPELDAIDRLASAYSVTAFSEYGVRLMINVLAFSDDQALACARVRWKSQGHTIEPDTTLKAERHWSQTEPWKRAILSFESFEEWELRRAGGA